MGGGELKHYISAWPSDDNKSMEECKNGQLTQEIDGESNIISGRIR